MISNSPPGRFRLMDPFPATDSGQSIATTSATISSRRYWILTNKWKLVNGCVGHLCVGFHWWILSSGMNWIWTVLYLTEGIELGCISACYTCICSFCFKEYYDIQSLNCYWNLVCRNISQFQIQTAEDRWVEQCWLINLLPQHNFGSI